MTHNLPRPIRCCDWEEICTLDGKYLILENGEECWYCEAHYLLTKANESVKDYDTQEIQPE